MMIMYFDFRDKGSLWISWVYYCKPCILHQGLYSYRHGCLAGIV